MKRNIILIDEEKCNGCGLCTKACAEGALEIIGGKAKLVSEVYCDGLGACLGKCPEDAIRIEAREAAAFDEHAVEQRLQQQAAPPAAKPVHGHGHSGCPGSQPRSLAAPVAAAAKPAHGKAPCGCPGSMARSFAAPEGAATGAGESGPPAPSELRQWPVQLHLVPVNAPYWQGADLLIAADCVPFACAGFHAQFLKDRRLIIGCPKLDDQQAYLAKLQAIFEQNDIRSITVVHMEVPCCHGLPHLVQTALKQSGKSIPYKAVEIGLRGEVTG